MSLGNLSCCFGLFAVLFSPAVYAGQQSNFPKSFELENIALGKSYTFSAKPNASLLCTDDSDSKQLTDGVYTAGPGYFWNHKSTVGFCQAQPIVITIDLESDQPICGVSYNCGAGTAGWLGVWFPHKIYMQVSADGKNFYEVGDLVFLAEELAPKSHEVVHATFAFRTTGLKTHGRYVRFVVDHIGRLNYIDEIEIFRGEKGFLKEPYAGSPVKIDANLSASESITWGIRRRCRLDEELLRQEVVKSKTIALETRAAILSELDALRREISAYQFKGDAKAFRAVAPVEELHADIVAQFGKLLSAQGFVPLTVWQSYRYDQLSLFEEPEVRPCSLDVSMMSNEYRADTLNLTNATAEAIEVTFHVENLPDCVEVRQVEFVDTIQGELTASVLVPVTREGRNYRTTVPAGMTSQLWFTFHTKDVKPGNYVGRVVIEADHFNKSVPVQLSVAPIEFPDRPSLKCGTWDFTLQSPIFSDFGARPEHQSASIRDLKSHFVNVPTAKRVIAGWPGIAWLDFAPFKAAIKAWPDAEHYMISLAAYEFKGFKPGTPEFREALIQWVKAFDAEARKLNLKPGQIIFNILDEPHTPQQYKLLENWIDIIKAESDMFGIFIDPLDLDKKAVQEVAIPVLKKADIVCPKTSSLKSGEVVRLLKSLVEQGHELWFFMCNGPSRLFDPAYYRMQPWQAFDMDAKGSCFWAYTDNGRHDSSWNPYTRKKGIFEYYSFAMVFLDDNGPVPTKSWEAVREGIEDYEYLVMLRDRLTQLQKKGVDSPWLTEAGRVLIAAVDNTVGNMRSGGEGLENLWSQDIKLEDPSKINSSKKRGNRSEGLWSKGSNYWKYQQDKSPCRHADEERLKVLELLTQLEELQF